MTSGNRVRTVVIAGVTLWMSGHGIAKGAHRQYSTDEQRSRAGC